MHAALGRLTVPLFVVLSLASIVCSSAAAQLAPAPPSVAFGELFARVQQEGMFADSKTFADATPRQSPEAIMESYARERDRADFDLRAFVTRHFVVHAPPSSVRALKGLRVQAYIDAMWSVLERRASEVPAHASLIATPERYVVPGGRFTEFYYWDSYFSLLGMEQSGRYDLTQAMVRNFAWLLDRFGRIPNGNRTYYLSRSQPPVFALMVELLAKRQGSEVYVRFLPQLRREHAFWMAGEERLAPREADRRVVSLPDGSLLNRYWDDRDTPRDESYREDLATARASGRPPAEVYRHLRAAAESGWDFSARWFADGASLTTIHTTDLIPPDLNALLYKLEQTIALACSLAHDPSCVADMRERAARRRAAMSKYLWNGELNAYVDFDFRTGRAGRTITAATLFPLYVGASDPVEARAIASTVRGRLLYRNGLTTTTENTGQQWDAPNGWAPLQWIAICGLSRYGYHELADLIARRWMRTNLEVYAQSGRLLEKYDVLHATAGTGGEYAVQDGFGWTNGVLRALLSRYGPRAASELHAPSGSSFRECRSSGN